LQGFIAFKMDVGMGKKDVIVESDCQVLTRLRESRSEDRSKIASILKEVEELSRILSRFIFKFIPRSANVAAHLRVKSASAIDRGVLGLT
jgi:hypothetical protein